LIANCAIYFIFGYILFFGLNWLPGYLEKTHQLGLTEAGFLLTLPWIAASLFVVAGGWASDYLMKKTDSVRIARTYPIAIGLLLTTVSFFFLPYTENLSVQLILLSLGFGFAFSINSPIYALNTDLFPTHPATAQGIISVFFALAGIISPLLTGWLVQTSHHFYSAMFFVSGLSLIGSLIAFFLQHPDSPSFSKRRS
jgi:ACS family hexuronate transporter-like MFS transporter